jgi:hypothetical protein
VSETTVLERIESPIYGAIVPIAAIQQNIVRVQQAKQEVMREGLHFGTIPGTPKPSLYKPGAELINLMFGVTCDPEPSSKEEHEGIDESGLRFYAVTIRMVLKTSAGRFFGASYGYASSLEEKYKWRKATGKKEFDATPEARRRVKFGRGKNNTEYEVLQVRTEVEDIKNTILQMAMKRAEVSGTKRSHALSDMFGQDLEDMPEEIRESVVEAEVVARDGTPTVQPGQRKSEQAANGTATKPHATAAAGTAAATAETKSPIGKVKAVEDKLTKDGKKTYYAIRLVTGFYCSSWSKGLADKLRAHEKAGDVVELVTEQPDPKFPPTLIEITLPVAAAAREPGEEG